MAALTVCRGMDILPYLDDLARLRCAVFRDWPYLYEGDPSAEARYLRTYAATPEAAMIVALDDGVVVGASTCIPLAAEPAHVRDPFAAAGFDPATICYFGESVLLRSHRGQGIGVAFFAEREAVARAAHATHAAFCAVRRTPTDPRRPPGDVALDAFWRNRGFAPQPITCAMSWREPGEPEEIPHILDAWMKRL